VFDNHILNPLLNDNLPYKDSELMPVMQIGRSAQGIAAYPTRPYNTFAEAIRAGQGRARQDQHRLARLQPGADLHRLPAEGERLSDELHPLQGGGPLYQDALAGVIDLAVSSLANMMPHVTAGKLKLVASTGDKRSRLAPNVPTLIEQGVKSQPSFAWWGVFAPAGTPRPIVERMYAAISKAVREPDVTTKFVDQFDMEVTLTPTDAFAAFVPRSRSSGAR
jgi:tripartite-type tricarboxylate transporter receptor subunit TctC